MESEDLAVRRSPVEARTDLHAVTAVRRRMRADPARRALAVFGLWVAVANAGYFLVFFLSWPPTAGQVSPAMLLLPLLLFTVLTRGALAARGARLRPRTAGTWVVIGAAVLIVVAGGVAAVTVGLPPAARIGIPLLLLLVQGPPALIALRLTEPAPLASPQPFAPPARITTAVLGVACAATVATSPWPVISGMVGLGALVLMGVFALASSTDWGLDATGAQWGRPQWTLFGIAAAAQGAAVVVAAAAPATTTAAVLAAAVGLSMLIAALVPAPTADRRR